jgi:hypothetical protein
MAPISKTSFLKFVDLVPFDKVARKAKSTEKGQRLWPSRTPKNDQNYNFRIDKGSTLPDGREEMIFQANKNAENKGVRESAQKDSHRLLAKVAVRPNEPADESVIKAEALDSFEENNK